MVEIGQQPQMPLVGTDSGKATIIATGFNGCKIAPLRRTSRSAEKKRETVSLIGWWVDKDNYVELKMDKRAINALETDFRRSQSSQ